MHNKIFISQPDFFTLRRGAVALPVLSDDELKFLNAEAGRLPFIPAKTHMPSGVVQHFSTRIGFEEGSPFSVLARETADQLRSALGPSRAQCTPIEFTDLRLQHYEVSPPGEECVISPHRDGKSFLNVVAVYILRGSAPFCLCDDREGSNPRVIDAEPGDLILMRATGFNRHEWNPFHFVGPVTEDRLTFGMRQKVPKEEVYKYYDLEPVKPTEKAEKE